MTSLILGIRQTSYRCVTISSCEWLAHIRAIALAVTHAIGAALVLGAPSAFAATACQTPVLEGLLPDYSNGESVRLRWSSATGARLYLVWAQWRVPEGEVIHTHEASVTEPAVQLPPSPARWRPLKLTIELRGACEGGTISQAAQLRQLQFDAQEEAACPPVDGLRFNRGSGELVWRGGVNDRIQLSFHQPGSGQLLEQRVVSGALLEWPAKVIRPTIIRAIRACGEVQRSRTTYLLAQ